MLFDLSDRVQLRLTGADRVRYLNGQVTNDIRKANPNLSLAACVLNAKGKMDAFVYVAGAEDELLVDADPELRETLLPRLERYLIADEVTIEDVSAEFGLFHVLGESAPVLPNESVHWRRSKRFGQAGWDGRVPAAEKERLRQSLAAVEPLCEGEARERFRIEQGVPRWGHELTDQIIPVEAGLANEAIDYAKGCYIGQETISRMKMSGQTNKRLCGLLSLDDSPLQANQRLTSAEAEGKDVGWITSATWSDRLGREIALGYVKRGANEIGTRLATVEVVELPFR